jgi:hypothetical protein
MLQKFLFIVPAHENNDCLADTVENIIAYNPDVEPYIVVYLAPSFQDFDTARFKKYKNLIVLKGLRRHFGHKYESQFESIIRCYRIAKLRFGTGFDYVQAHHTSQLFAQLGYGAYAKDFDYCRDQNQDRLPNHYHALLQNNLLAKFFDSTLAENYDYQMIETTFYSGRLFDLIDDAVETFPFTLGQITDIFHHTPVEEVLIPTLARYFSEKNGFNISTDLTLNWMADQLVEDFTMKDHQFTIKSVPRDIDHPVRVKLR